MKFSSGSRLSIIHTSVISLALLNARMIHALHVIGKRPFSNRSFSQHYCFRALHPREQPSIVSPAQWGQSRRRFNKSTTTRLGDTSDGSSSSSSSISTRNYDEEPAATKRMRDAAVEESNRLYQWYHCHDGGGANISPETKPVVWQSPQDAAMFIRDEIDTVLFDCDGVLYRTFDQCPGAADCIRSLMFDQKKTVLFVTNNAGVNRRELRQKLTKILQLGDDSLTTEQMISSSYSAAQYLKQELVSKDDNHQSNRTSPRVHVIGSSGLCEELVNNGFDISGGPSPDAPSHMTRQELEDYDFSEHPINALVVGHDTEMNFRKLSIAANLLLRNPNALFVATNRDSFDLVGGDRRHIPGNGATIVALEYASLRTAVNVGKPSSTLMKLIQSDHKGFMDVPSRCLFVGDRLDTDIKFGKDNGMKSLLVMTGVTTSTMMEDLGDGTDNEPLPDFIAPYVGILC